MAKHRCFKALQAAVLSCVVVSASTQAKDGLHDPIVEPSWRASVVPATSAIPPQFVMLAFDGGMDNDFWQQSRDFAAANDVKFTYFVSCVYYIADADRKTYIEPRNGPGKSSIGWGGKPADIAERLKQTALAKAEGHEIASHGCGHFDGGKYSAEMWTSEFTQFNTIMAEAWKRYGAGTEPVGWSDYFQNQSYGGFRAPFLSFNKDALWSSLTRLKFVYDTSAPSRAGDWPKKDGALWEFPLVGLRIAGSRASTLSMDYNFYVAQTQAVRGNPKNFQLYEDQMFNTYMAYFKASYYGNRAPLHIGHHFAQWNGGAYWKALQRFIKDVCNSKAYPDVKCTNYSELADFMNAHVAELDNYQKGNFASPPTAPTAAVQTESQPLSTVELHKTWAIDPVQSHTN
ncbi:MAG: polysaccharide deacetylase family protein [Alphaproteobacteria bacterium]|nr:polysaccharide deacetylase family protein [Alphaproteobacteria bacterium]